MSFPRTSQVVALFLLGLLLAAQPLSAADPALARAKELYASAAYEEALAALDQIEPADSADGRAASEYRVFCLLALDRKDEARKNIETLLRDNPHYTPPTEMASPRIENAIRDVRKQALPKIVTDRYALAKSAFERKDPQALPRFEEVLKLMDDPDVRGVTALNDLRTVVTGFRDLAQAMAATPPPPAPAARAAAAAAPAKPAEAAPTPAAAAPAAVIYTLGDTDVKPPVAKLQKLPEWRPPTRDVARDYTGTLALLIDEHGAVAQATLRTSIHPLYDKILLNAVRDWKFTPATRQGVPVRYLRVVDVRLQPK